MTGPAQIPVTPTDTLSLEEAKRVSWVELFYDLVFVFAVTQVSHLLSDSVTWSRLLESWVVFTPFWWAWVGASVLSNLTDLDHHKDRLRLFGIVLATLLMTAVLPYATRGQGVFFAGCFVALRALLAWWSADRFGGLRLNPFTLSAFVTAPLLLATSALPQHSRLVVWAILMLGELSTTWLLRARLKALRLEPAHLPERFGLVIMISLGESIGEAGRAVRADVRLSQLIALIIGFALCCGLWWIYFHFSNGAVEHQLRTEEDQSRVIREILAYGHYLLTCSIVMVAVGTGYVVEHPGPALPPALAWLLCGGTALFLAVFAWPRWGITRLLVAARLSVAAGGLVLGALNGAMPGVVLTGVLAAMVCAMAWAETRALVPKHPCVCGCRSKRSYVPHQLLLKWREWERFER